MTNNDVSVKNNTDTTSTDYANISETNRQELTHLENIIQKETGEKVALVAYRI